MKEKLNKIEKLISENKIDMAQFELSKLGQEFHRNPEYLYLRSKIFFSNKLYYIAIDTLLIALEFEQNDKFYNLIAEIYEVIDNKERRCFAVFCATQIVKFWISGISLDFPLVADGALTMWGVPILNQNPKKFRLRRHNYGSEIAL